MFCGFEGSRLKMTNVALFGCGRPCNPKLFLFTEYEGLYRIQPDFDIFDNPVRPMS